MFILEKVIMVIGAHDGTIKEECAVSKGKAKELYGVLLQKITLVLKYKIIPEDGKSSK